VALSRLQLRITAGELDKIVAEARGDEPGSESKERWHVKRWPELVATADLLNDLVAGYARHVILSEHGAAALALWTLHAWALDAAYCSPLLMLVSPEPRCGKSTVLKLLYWTCPRTVLAGNISGPAIYRYVETYTPTLLLDEAETYVADNEGVRGILNSGHDRATAIVIRQVGDNHEETKEFSTWAPKAIASIGKLAATLRDRAIILPMKRKKRDERVEKLRGRNTGEFRTIREKARRWTDDNVQALKDAHPSLPDINDRAADNWELLLAIANLAGGDWPARARAAALKLSGDADSSAETIGVQLLGAIKRVFETLGVDRITSEALAEQLAKDKDSPWAVRRQRSLDRAG
jgi:putative DNA primase/helicase